jgi:hypothetical protein
LFTTLLLKQCPDEVTEKPIGFRLRFAIATFLPGDPHVVDYKNGAALEPRRGLSLTATPAFGELRDRSAHGLLARLTPIFMNRHTELPVSSPPGS